MQKHELHYAPAGAKAYVVKFEVRNDTDNQDTAQENSDLLVINEIFNENVYQFFDGDIAREGSVVVDIGANIGAFSILSAIIGANGASRILAFEPDIKNLQCMKQNLKLNDLQSRVEVYDIAIYDEEGEMEFVSSQGNSHVAKKHEKSQANNKVKKISFDDMFEKYGLKHIDVLKIDIEGAEYKLFENASIENLRKVNYITMEMHSASAEDFGQLIAKLSMTHNLHIIGKHTQGGQIYGRSYNE